MRFNLFLVRGCATLYVPSMLWMDPACWSDCICLIMSRINRFIIADDDPDLRFFVRRIILKVYPDATVAEAANGEEALEMYDQKGADLMVIDHMIPFLNGTDLIRKLRARKVSIPLV